MLFQLSVLFFGLRLVRFITSLSVSPLLTRHLTTTHTLRFPHPHTPPPGTLPHLMHQVKSEAVDAFLKLVNAKKDYVRYIR